MKRILTILLSLLLLAKANYAQITYVASNSVPVDGASATQASSGAVAVAPPTGTQTGDLIVVHAVVRNNTGTVTITETSGQTWTSETEHSGTDSRIFWCRFNGTWGSNPSFTFSAGGGSIPAIVTIHAFRPTATNYTWAVDVAQATGSASSGTTQTITGVTTIATRTVSFAVWSLADDATWGTLTGTGWNVLGTAQYRNTTGSDMSGSYAYQIRTSAGATNNTSKTSSIAASGTIPFASHIIAFKEVAPVPETGTHRFFQIIGMKP